MTTANVPASTDAVEWAPLRKRQPRSPAVSRELGPPMLTLNRYASNASTRAYVSAALREALKLSEERPFVLIEIGMPARIIRVSSHRDRVRDSMRLLADGTVQGSRLDRLIPPGAEGPTRIALEPGANGYLMGSVPADVPSEQLA